MKKFYIYVNGECMSTDNTASEAIESAAYYGGISEAEAAKAFEMAAPFGEIKNASGRAVHPADFPGVRVWIEEENEE
jgi:hypothetical protein